jgi:hypothetical protein
VNDLRERLDRLADAAADGIKVARPDRGSAAGAVRPWWRSGPAVLALAAGVVVAGAAGTAAVLVGRDDGDDDVAVGDDTDATAGTADGAVVAVTYGDASLSGEPVDLTLQFLAADGELIAERSWSEVEQGGLVQPVPAGELSLEATLQQLDGPASCTQRFTADAGDRLILRLQFGASTCADIQPVDDWVEGRSTQTGADYIGLTQAEAEEQAQAAGLTTRVVGVDGMDLVITMDLRTDRLDLMLFDGTVVAASLPGDAAAPAGGEGTLAVDLEPVDAPFPEGFDVTLQFYGADGELVGEPLWSDSVAAAGVVDDGSGLDPAYTHVLREVVPAGPVRLVTSVRGVDCETTVDVGAGDAARVTLRFARDERGACASVAAANAAADELLGMPRGLPAPGFVGLSEDEAMDEASARGWTVRVLARDGQGDVRTDDYSPERLNLVLEDGVVVAAART